MAAAQAPWRLASRPRRDPPAGPPSAPGRIRSAASSRARRELHSRSLHRTWRVLHPLRLCPPKASSRSLGVFRRSGGILRDARRLARRCGARPRAPPHTARPPCAGPHLQAPPGAWRLPSPGAGLACLPPRPAGAHRPLRNSGPPSPPRAASRGLEAGEEVARLCGELRPLRGSGGPSAGHPPFSTLAGAASPVGPRAAPGAGGASP